MSTYVQFAVQVQPVPFIHNIYWICARGLYAETFSDIINFIFKLLLMLVGFWKVKSFIGGFSILEKSWKVKIFLFSPPPSIEPWQDLLQRRNMIFLSAAKIKKLQFLLYVSIGEFWQWNHPVKIVLILHEVVFENNILAPISMKKVLDTYSSGCHIFIGQYLLLLFMTKPLGCLTKFQHLINMSLL